MRIEVTAEDIDQATATYSQEYACQCPIALAVCRAIGRAPSGERFGIYAYDRSEPKPTKFILSEGGHRRIAVLPDAANDFIRRFDAFQTVEPFSFDIDLPAPSPGTEKP